MNFQTAYVKRKFGTLPMNDDKLHLNRIFVKENPIVFKSNIPYISIIIEN